MSIAARHPCQGVPDPGRLVSSRIPELPRVALRCYTEPMTKLRALLSGDLSLDEAFWTWAVTIGVLVNLVTSLLFVTLIMQDRPLAAVIAGYAVSVPYNIVATVGVWRSAARYPGPPA